MQVLRPSQLSEPVKYETTGFIDFVYEDGLRK